MIFQIFLKLPLPVSSLETPQILIYNTKFNKTHENNNDDENEINTTIKQPQMIED